MKKKTLISLLTVGVLGVTVIGGAFLFRNHESGIDSDASVRTAQEILDGGIFLDEGALAGAMDSAGSASLRSDAWRQ